jgi:hypothetical protein
VRDHLLLRTEATSNNVADFGVPKAHLGGIRRQATSVANASSVNRHREAVYTSYRPA